MDETLPTTTPHTHTRKDANIAAGEWVTVLETRVVKKVVGE